MNVLIYAVNFWTSTGGCKTITRLIANHLHDPGHRVTVVTQTRYDEDEPFSSRGLQPVR